MGVLGEDKREGGRLFSFPVSSFLSCCSSLLFVSVAFPLKMAKAVKRRRNELLEKERADEEERKMCKVCFANDACAVLLPCGHICVCEACALQLEDCPICKTPIEERKRVYHA
mmetsp:Transcript_42636/g.109728  ORF Transcript_42636/g.109728 Transcript_42636/m.109728 type:complete len:113 (-) Transcript_42636:6871-7209(-)